MTDSIDDIPVVVIAADRNYALPLTITLFSMLLNIRDSNGARIFVLDGGLTLSQKSKICNILSRLKHSIEWITVPESLIRHLPLRKHLSIATYYRLLLPELLPTTITKVIYLDCDLLVEGDITELWAQDPGLAYVMAVQGQGSKQLIATTPLSKIKKLNYEPDEQYFNAGVLVLNLSAMRSDQVGRRAISLIAQYKDVLRHDQDGINAVCIKRWKKLDPKWNQFAKPSRGRAFDKREGGILHFTSAQKPWDARQARFRSGDTAKSYSDYQSYLRTSGWHSDPEWVMYLTMRNIFKIMNLLSGFARAIRLRLLWAVGLRPHKKLATTV